MLYGVKSNDAYDLRTRYENEHGNNKTHKEKKIETRYKALCEWQTTDATSFDVAAKYDDLKPGAIRSAKNNDAFGLYSKFLNEHPEYVD